MCGKTSDGKMLKYVLWLKLVCKVAFYFNWSIRILFVECEHCASPSFFCSFRFGRSGIKQFQSLVNSFKGPKGTLLRAGMLHPSAATNLFAVAVQQCSAVAN